MVFTRGELFQSCFALYVFILTLHALTFPKRNPLKRPRRQNVTIVTVRMLFGLPANILFGCWLGLWLAFWEVSRQPLWKPILDPSRMPRKVGLELCGGGFRTWYHLGVYWGLYDSVGALGLRQMYFSGASIGALVAAVAACGIHPADIWAHIPAIADGYRRHFVWHFSQVGQFCRYLLHSLLPEDAHLLVKGRLFISISLLLPFPHNVLRSEFISREDLIDAVIASQFIPTWTHPGVCFYQGNMCIDGGATNNLPAISDNAVRVGLDADDILSWCVDLLPSQPLTRANTFYPADEGSLQRMLDCGKDDVLDWLSTARGGQFLNSHRASS
jgi:hypothetical protein